MSIRFGDFRLSGRAWHTLEDSARRVLALDGGVHTDELVLVGYRDERETVALGGGLDLTMTKRLDVGLRMDALASPLRLRLYRGDENEPPSTIIDGLLYLDHILDQAPTPEPALRAFVDVMTVLAGQLDARWLHLADEDEDRLALGGGLLLPSVCGVYVPALVDDLIAPLRGAGAIVDDTLVRGHRVVWAAPIETLLEDHDRSLPAAAFAVLRDRLARA